MQTSLKKWHTSNRLMIFEALPGETIIGDDSGRTKWRMVKSHKSGSGGYTSLVTCINWGDHDNMEYVMKCIPFGKMSKGSARKEMRIQQKASELGVAIPIIDSWISDSQQSGFIVMDRLNDGLSDEIREMALEEQNSTVLNILDLVIKLNNAGILHNDIRLENIVYKIVPDGRRWYLIDFGMSMFVDSCDDDIRRLENMIYWFDEIPVQFRRVFDNLLKR